MKIFWVVKAKKAALVLVACFALLLVAYSVYYASGEAWTQKGKTVVFLGHELDPKAPDLEDQVTRLVESLVQPPVDAQYDEVNKSVIPDLNGFEIEVKACVKALKGAKGGAVVAPVWRETAADRQLADFPLLPVYQGNPLRNQVALVVNVSWGNEYLEEMLAIFAEQEVVASFFLVGRWAEENPDLVKRIQELGMDFGNHGYSDPHMAEMNPEAIREEVARTNKAVKELTGVEMRWFSPPYGEKVEKIYAAAADLGLHTVLWSLDTVDWTLPGEETIVRRIVDNLANGGIILMHPTEQTPGALKRIIEGTREKNLELVTVSQLLSPSYWPEKYRPLWQGN